MTRCGSARARPGGLRRAGVAGPPSPAAGRAAHPVLRPGPARAGRARARPARAERRPRGGGPAARCARWRARSRGRPRPGGPDPAPTAWPGALLLEVAGAASTAREFARYRLRRACPTRRTRRWWTCCPSAGARVLAAAVRRSVVEGYEAVARGRRPRRRAAGPGAPGRARRARARAARHRPCPWTSSWATRRCPWPPGRAACCTSFRNRLRDRRRGEPRGWRARSTARRRWPATGPPRGSAPCGAGAAALLRALERRGPRAASRAGARRARCPSEAAELAWLGAALA